MVNYHNKQRFSFKSLYFLVLLLPVSISFSRVNGIGLDRLGGGVSRSSEYILTIPLSAFFAAPFIVFFIFDVVKNTKIAVFTFCAFLSVLSVALLSGFDAVHISLVAKVVFPVYLYYAYYIYFRNKYTVYARNNALPLNRDFAKDGMLSSFVIFLSVYVAGLFIYGEGYYWGVKNVIIYDFYQYFPLIFLVVLGVIDTNNRVLFVVVFIISLYVSHLSSNTTAFVLISLYGVYHLIGLVVSGSMLVLVSKVTVIVSALMVIIYPLVIVFVYEQIAALKFVSETVPVMSRVNVLNNFYGDISFLEFVTPLRIHENVANHFLHNELSVIVSVLGIFGACLFYFIFLRALLSICVLYPKVAVALGLFLFVSGLMLTPMLHLYTLIIFCYVVSYYKYSVEVIRMDVLRVGYYKNM